MGAAWDEAYRLRAQTGSTRVEPLFEVDGREWTTERGSARAGLLPPGRPDKEAARKDPEWSLKHVRAFEAWELLRRKGRARGEEGKDVIIAQPDTGYRPHPESWDPDELKSPVLFKHGYDFLAEDDDPLDEMETTGLIPTPGHGTRAGSVIVSPKGKQWTGGTDKEYVTGVAPGARLVPMRVHRSVVFVDSGRLARSIFEAASDDRTVVGKKAQVVSIAMGGVPGWALWRAVRYAEKQGLILVAAAGNEVGTVVWPARFEEAIAVAASNVDCGTWEASSRGTAVDITAPGESVWHAAPDLQGNDWVGMGQGTTYSTATLSGVAALWLDYHRDDPALAELKRSGRLQSAFRDVLERAAWQPGVSPSQAPAGAICTTGGRWNAKEFGPGIVDAVKVLTLPLPALQGASMEPTFRDLPLFSTLFERGTARSLIEARYRKLLRVPPDADLDAAAELESEILFNYATEGRLRPALDAVTGAREPSEGEYQEGRSALAARDISTRLRQALQARRE